MGTAFGAKYLDALLYYVTYVFICKCVCPIRLGAPSSKDLIFALVLSSSLAWHLKHQWYS